MNTITAILLSTVYLTVGTSVCLASTDDAVRALEDRVADLERRLEETRKAYETEIAALREELTRMKSSGAQQDQDLERELSEALAADTAQPPTGATTGALKLLDTSVDIISNLGVSTVDPELFGDLQGGAHDPKRNGFTFSQLELSFTGAVDPFLKGEVHLVNALNSGNETITELEEAFLTTTALPSSLEVKAGQYFLPFGRLNPQHPHQWEFVDQPIINVRLFGGDGARSPGAQVSWLTPLKWYSELTFGLFNPRGETMTSFIVGSKEGDGHLPDIERVDREVRSLGDMVYLLRWFNSWPLGEERTLNLGFSGLFGPNDTGYTNRTRIYGVDAYWKWKPVSNDHGWPFLAWQTEAMLRDYDFGMDPRETLRDWGMYTQLLWGYQRDWVLGLRAEFADGDTTGDPLRSRRFRLSPSLTWYPSEFSRIRLQYNFDDGDFFGRSEHSIWLQYEIGMGAHPAHKF